MKKKQFFLLALLVSLAFSFKKPVLQSSRLIPGAPAIELVEVQPSDAGGNLFFMSCAAKTSADKSSAQLSAKFTIRNKETRALVLKSITYSYQKNGIAVLKLMTPDIDDNSVKSFTINKGASFSWQNSRDYHDVDNAVFFDTPYPPSIQIRLLFDGYTDPFIITRNLKIYSNNTSGNAYGFPGRLSHLKEGEYWYAYGGHGGGGQFYAYDFKVEGWDSKAKKWSNVFPGKDGSANDHYRAYGKDIIAVADGKVLDFSDGVAENKGNAGGGSGGGNWFKINNGKETICYYHMQPGSLSSHLKKKGANVKKGEKLGLLGNSGNSSEPHGHVHAIIDPDADGEGQWVPLNFSDIYMIDKNELSAGPDPDASWTKVEKKGLPFLQGRRCMIWPSASKPCLYPGGLGEIGRNAIPENIYQQEFMKIWNCGYYPVWVDAYDVAGKTYFNTIFRYNTGNVEVAVKHDMTKESFQQEYQQWVGQKGYRLQQLDNYNDNGKLKFAAIFIKKNNQPASQPAYHAQSAEEHQQLFEQYTGQGYVPVNVSVTSVGGKKYYSAFYEKRNVGTSMLKSSLTQQQYQELFDEMKQKKWEQVYINAYHHDGQILFSVIWYQDAGYKSFTATRKSDLDGYQDKYTESLGDGYLTRCVTGYEEGGKHWFAAHWSK
jgi:murein DD-endopeptidase MepM/ murein hydrolase activator NlpD